MVDGEDMKEDLNWIADVVSDLYGFCVKNDLQETANSLSRVARAFECEVNQMSSPPKTPPRLCLFPHDSADGTTK